jgi:phage terminase large subunit-like protein
VRAQGIRARIETGMVYLPIFDPAKPAEYPWVTELVYELVRFPAVAHDDQVDVFSLLGRMLNALSKGEAEQAPEPPLVVGPNTYTIEQLLKMQPKASTRI